MATAIPVNTGRWTDEEHAAFEDGLRQYGTNWRAVQRLIPSRTLVQIRTHAQKYFLKHGIIPGAAQNSVGSGGTGDGDDTLPAGPAGGSSSSSSSSTSAAASAGAAGGAVGSAAPAAAPDLPAQYQLPSNHGSITLRPVATLRHVLLEPLHPRDELGMVYRTDAASGAVFVAGFVPVAPAAPAASYNGGAGSEGRPWEANPVSKPVTVTVPSLASLDPSPLVGARPEAPAGSVAYEPVTAKVADTGLQPGIGEESDLVRVGDVVAGVSGVSTVGMNETALKRAIATARACTPGGAVVLSLSDVPLGPSLAEEATLQVCHAACALLDGNAPLVADIQAAVLAAFQAAHAPAHPVTGVRQDQAQAPAAPAPAPPAPVPAAPAPVAVAPAGAPGAPAGAPGGMTQQQMAYLMYQHQQQMMRAAAGGAPVPQPAQMAAFAAQQQRAMMLMQQQQQAGGAPMLGFPPSSAAPMGAGSFQQPSPQ